MPEETTQTPETTQTATTETTQTSAEGTQTQTQTADPAPAVTEQTLLNQGEQQAAEAAAQVPESYEAFTDAQGKPVSNEDFKGFTEAAKSVGLSQENAQKMFSAMYGEADNYVRRRTQEFAAQWAEQSKADPEFGGANFNQNMGQIATAYKQFATPELKHLLDASGLGNHPEVMRLFYRVGKALSQDTGVRAQGAPEQQHRMFPKSNMVV